MARISLQRFGGMVPRLGEQQLKTERLRETGLFASPGTAPVRNYTEGGLWATQADNTNLYSGELRPLHKPALAHEFASPCTDDWKGPDFDSCPGKEPPLGNCIRWGPTVSQVTLAEVFDSGDYSNTRLPVNFGNGCLRTMGYIACSGDNIFATDPLEDQAFPRSNLYYSGDFGQSWVKCNDPVDEIGEAVLADHATNFPGQFGWTSLRFIGPVLFGNFHRQGTRESGRYSTSDGGQTWSMIDSYAANADYEPDSHGLGRGVNRYCYFIGETNGQPIYGGIPSDIIVGQSMEQAFVIGNGASGLGLGNSLYSDWTWTIDDFDENVIYPPNGNVYQIAKVSSGYVYISQTNTNRDDQFLACPPNYLNGNKRRLNTISFNSGAGQWRANTTGTWYQTDVYNCDVAGDWVFAEVKDGPWPTDGTDVLMPMDGNNTSTEPNFGKYVRAVAASALEVDYSSLFVAGPDDGDFFSFSLHYVKALGQWALFYVFDNTDQVNDIPNRFYVRVSPTYQPADFGPAQTLNLPNNDFFLASVRGRGTVRVEFSNTRQAWVIGSVTNQGSTANNQERLRVYTFPYSFECIEREVA